MTHGSITPTDNAPQAPWRAGESLTVHTIAEQHRQLLDHVAVNRDLVLDLEHLATCDCAGLQLLCAARQTAVQSGFRFELLRCPESVRSTARNLGLDLDSLLAPVAPPQP